MGGSNSKLFIQFDQGKIDTNWLKEKSPEKIRVIQIPIHYETKSWVQRFMDMLDHLAKRLENNENLSNPQIVKSFRRRYSKKFSLELTLKEIEKHLSTYPSNLLQSQPHFDDTLSGTVLGAWIMGTKEWIDGKPDS